MVWGNFDFNFLSLNLCMTFSDLQIWNQLCISRIINIWLWYKMFYTIWFLIWCWCFISLFFLCGSSQVFANLIAFKSKYFKIKNIIKIRQKHNNIEAEQHTIELPLCQRGQWVINSWIQIKMKTWTNYQNLWTIKTRHL